MANSEKLGEKKAGQDSQNENFVTKIINFFNKYQNIIYGVIIAILVVVAAILAINKFYLQPKSDKAASLIVAPIDYFMKGDSASLQLALEGDDENDGFLTIIDNYGITRTANTAKFYAGLTYLKLNDTESALEYLSNFKKKDDVMWYLCQIRIGDIYDDQGDAHKALKYYTSASKCDNSFVTPIALFKIGQMYERTQEWEKALNAYETIEKDYYADYTKMSVDKFAERAKLNLNK